MSQLKKTYAQIIPEVGSAMKAFPWDNKLAYANWIAQTYYFANVTTRLLLMVGAHLPLEEQKLHHRFIDHAKEERGHEILLLRDLKEMGQSIENLPELAPTSALYQTQYYWIQHRSPLAFFGYIVLLEGLGAEFGTPIFKEVSTHHGVKAAQFLKVHGEEDIDHVEKALQELASLDSKTEKIVIENFKQAASFYTLILKEIEAASRLGMKKVA